MYSCMVQGYAADSLISPMPMEHLAIQGIKDIQGGLLKLIFLYALYSCMFQNYAGNNLISQMPIEHLTIQVIQGI